jgi:hypothetical protein
MTGATDIVNIGGAHCVFDSARCGDAKSKNVGTASSVHHPPIYQEESVPVERCPRTLPWVIVQFHHRDPASGVNVQVAHALSSFLMITMLSLQKGRPAIRRQQAVIGRLLAISASLLSIIMTLAMDLSFVVTAYFGGGIALPWGRWGRACPEGCCTRPQKRKTAIYLLAKSGIRQ